MITIAEDRIITGIEYKDREKDSRLGNKERIFTLQTKLAKKPKQGKHEEIVEITNKDIHILFTDNGFSWEDVPSEFDHIIEAKKKVEDTTLLSYIIQIKQQLSSMLIKNPRHPNYKSLYSFVQSYPDLKDILQDYRIQDWDNFDETLYTDPVDKTESMVNKQTEIIQAHKKSREDFYAIYKDFCAKETSIRLHINTTKRLLENNTTLVNDSSVQEWQKLHGTYQGILQEIAVLTSRMDTYQKDLRDIENTSTIVQSKLDSYNKSLLQENPTRKSKKIQQEIKHRLPNGPTQGIVILGWLNKQCATLEDALCNIEQLIIDAQKKLGETEEELINIFPPAHELFTLVQLEEKQLSYDYTKKQDQREQTKKAEEQYTHHKNTKDTFVFLYEEAKILTDFCNNRFYAPINDFYKKVTNQAIISDKEENLYTAIKRDITTYHQQKGQSVYDINKINNVLLNAVSIGRNFVIMKDKRSSFYKETYPQLTQHIDEINKHTQQIHIHQETISQERITHSIPKNQVNDTIREKNMLIKDSLRAIKEHIEKVHAHILAQTAGSISGMSEELLIMHNNRFAVHKQENSELSGHFEAIRLYTKQIQTLQELIAQERKTHHIPKNESNDTIKEHNKAIDQHKKNSKIHTTAIDAYMYEPANAVRLSEQVEKGIDQTISRRKTTITSTQRSITNLLASPNNLIIIQDIDTLSEELNESEINLTRLLENLSSQEYIVSQSTDLRYQTLLPFDVIIDNIIAQYQELTKMDNLLNNYLPRPGYKMSDTDRSIKNKRDVLRDYKGKSIELARTIIEKLEDAMDNKDLSRNKPIQSMHQKIVMFVVNNEMR